jgi:hypothetical protein
MGRIRQGGVVQHKGPSNEVRLGPTDPLGVAFTTADLVARLLRLDRDLPIVSGRNNEKGIALHLHTFVDPSDDYISFTHLHSSFEADAADREHLRKMKELNPDDPTFS